MNAIREMIGTTLSHFKITAKLGEGGMGEVYRADDTKLGRKVAIKVLPEAVASDRERLARFAREAKVLASLNHPNIAAIYEVGEAADVRFLAMELAEGEDLAGRLSRGPIPVEDAAPLALQIAEALEAAHEKGIVHRDLKPANVMVGPDATIKVLDFGLAKAWEEEPEDSSSLSLSPTFTAQTTRAGMILGTAAYMSPEQARGNKVDRRSDIWSFGVVLWEMLTGRRAFQGETVTDVLAALLAQDPDWELLPASTPPTLRTLLERCLEKEVSMRLRDIGEARIAIDKYLSGDEPAVEPPETPIQSATRRRLRWAITVLALIGLLFAVWQPWRPTSSAAPHSSRLRVEVAPGKALPIDLGPAVILSPDGRRTAYVAKSGESQQLYLRSSDQFQATPLAGTEGARNPFFSPNGEWIGFFTEKSLKKVSVSGGLPVTVCPTRRSRGGTWGPDDTIVFNPHITSELWRVPATGGTASVLTTKADGIRTHRWPQFLPDGRHVVFMSQPMGFNYDESDIVVVNIESGESKVVHQGGQQPSVLPTGHLAFVRNGTLFLAPFDLQRVEVTGQPVPAIENLQHHTGRGGAQYSFSTTGDLAYVEGPFADLSLSLISLDREGNLKALPVDPHVYNGTTLSPDGTRLAVDIQSGVNNDIWIVDLERGVSSRLTFDSAKDVHPIWTPSGDHVTFTSYRGQAPSIYWQPSNGAGEAKPLVSSPRASFPASWSPDGSVLAFLQQTANADFDIWVLVVDEQGEPQQPEVFLATSSEERDAAFSPNGNWLAYSSDESGHAEIYVRPYPTGKGKWQISSAGGRFPRWSGSDSELFFRNEAKMMVVAYHENAGAFLAESPQELFDEVTVNHPMHPSYDVYPDGDRFVMIGLVGEEQDNTIDNAHINLILNWFGDVRRLLPPN